ncbi:MAG: hypothetical protein JF606_27195 [Burkholderiales bacterium]|jgi:hypothetical protein|nr:hypothetical protein [Burkholderiales bacterium]
MERDDRPFWLRQRPKPTGTTLGTVNSYVSSLLLALDVKSRSHMVSLFR